MNLLEANVEVLENRLAVLVAATRAEIAVLHRFRQTRQNLDASGEPMTGAQKVAALAALQTSHDAKQVANANANTAFSATDPIPVPPEE